MKKLFAGILLAAALGACGPKHSAFVKVDNVALGRVVVYRNGVAFYERRATVSGGVLTVSVPRDRVDDFLKSLTVVDAFTQQPLPVSIPRREEDGANLVMRLQLPTKATADVVLTYVTEAPSWKPSYRVVVGKDGKVMLEGWAIVDNTSGEDWKGVKVGVGSSSALSFKYDLWSVRQVQREMLASEEKFAIAPPTGVSPYGKDGNKDAGGDMMVGELSDQEIRRPVGHPQDAQAKRTSVDTTTVAANEHVVEVEVAKQPRPTQIRGRKGGGSSGGGQAYAPKSRPPQEPARPQPPPPPDSAVRQGDEKVRNMSRSFAKSDKTIVIEGYADGNVADAARRANDRANIVRNQLIDEGVAPARIRIVTHTEAGNAERVRLVAQAPTPDQAQQQKSKGADVDAQPVGESHFGSDAPMTVEKGSSAMVSMVRQETIGEVVYLYDAESERGNDRFAFRAVKFVNPTDSTLETGPVTVYGSERFIGEGLTEPIAPKSAAVVPFALDRQIVIDRNDGEEDRISKLVTLQRGILTAEVQHVRRRRLVVTNRLPQPAKVYIRHTLNKGWAYLPNGKPPREERVGDSQLFEIDVPAGGQQKVEIAEATPIQRTLDLNADVTLEMMKLYIETPELTPELRDQLKKLFAIHHKLADLSELQISLRRRLNDFKERMDELHGQIVTLQAVKTGGELMSHLKEKMKDISERVQKTTIKLVDSEEQIMLARVQFQDALAELTLPDAAQHAALKP
jgi:hypothetical protein